MIRMRLSSHRTASQAAAWCLPAILLLVPLAARADSVRTSASSGFARIHFTLDPLAHAKVTQSSGVVMIAFDRKVSIAPPAIAQGLSAYITNVREDTDGETFRLALAQTVRVHTSISANNIAVDLAPEGFAGNPPDLPPPPPKARTAVDVARLPVLPIRVGGYSTFSRLVFDWPKKTAYAVFPGAGHLTVRFEAMVRPDFSALESVAPPWIKESGWRIEGRGTVIEFDTDASSGFHDFKDGTKIVLDILAPKADASAYKPPTDTGKPAGAVKVTKLERTATGAAEAKAVMDTVRALHGDDAAKKTTPQPADPKPANAAASVAPSPPAAPTPAVPAPAAATSTVQAQQSHGVSTLNFPGAAEHGVAAFIRGETAWIVLDNGQPLDTRQLKAVLGDAPLDASSEAGASLLRIGLKQPERIEARANGSDLTITISPDVSPVVTPISFSRDDDMSRAGLGALVPGAVHALTIVDPVVGDTLVVVPSIAGRAIPQQRNYAEFSILQTGAGVALSPFADDLNVAVKQSRVTIGRREGLALAAPGMAAAAIPAALSKTDSSPCFLDFAAWAGPPGGNILQEIRRLRHATAGMRPEETDRNRIRLARFYLANGFSAEALGTLNVIQGANPALKSDAQLQTMRGAADYMLGRYRDAQNDLSSSMFDTDRHAAFWRGLVETAQRNWDAARKDFALAEPVMRRYVPEWRARAAIADTRAAVATDAVEVAETQLVHLPAQLPRHQALEAQLARAEVFAAEGRYGDARAIFQSIESGGDERVGAEAVYADVEAGLAAGSLSQDNAIGMLEQLRFRWRGDALELQTLRKLGALYFAKQRWHQGLATLRIASQNFPNEDLARQAQDDMRKAFETLFLKGNADKLPPIQALGLFYDFIDLTPIGPNGDEMIRHMADRLVAVDLLEPAASLLNYQVSKRLDGIARAQVATRLAMIDLLDHKPKDALEALRTSQVTGLPPDDLHQRAILQSRALAVLKLWDQALDIIGTDDSPDTRQLRADIYWESGNWDIAGQKAELIAAAAAGDPKPLSDAMRADVLRAAIAYSLAGDEPAVGRLRKSFAAKMGASPDASAFALVTQSLDTQGTAFRDMAGQIASIDTLETFMKDFKKRYDAARVTN
jgi:tetratricopeptide (TPR) repeat protein